MSSKLYRTDLQIFVQGCTLKLCDTKGNLLGSGFYAYQDKIITCKHVLFQGDKLMYQEIMVNGDLFKIDQFETSQEDSVSIDLCVITGKLIADKVINIKSHEHSSGDKAWGWSYNTKYPDGVGLNPTLQEEAIVNGVNIFQIDKNSVWPGSSGTPIINTTNGSFLGIVFYKTNEFALIIPSSYIKNAFPGTWFANQQFHSTTTYWEELVISSVDQNILSKRRLFDMMTSLHEKITNNITSTKSGLGVNILLAESGYKWYTRIKPLTSAKNEDNQNTGAGNEESGTSYFAEEAIEHETDDFDTNNDFLEDNDLL